MLLAVIGHLVVDFVRHNGDVRPPLEPGDQLVDLGLAGLEACPMHMGKDALGQSRGRDTFSDSLRYDLGSLGMGRMGLHDHRTAGSEGRSRIAARRGIGKGKVAGPEDHNGTYRHLQFAEIGFGFALFLTFMEEYILQKWCIYCLWSQGIITAILAVSIAMVVMDWRRKRAELVATAS